MPPEAVPIILAIQERKRLNNEKPLTIREVQWAGKLIKVVNNTKVLPITEVLAFWATRYGMKEQYSEMMDRPLDTSSLDSIFVRYAEEYAAYPAIWENMTIYKDSNAAIKMACGLIHLRTKALRHELTEVEREILDLSEQREKERPDFWEEVTFARDFLSLDDKGVEEFLKIDWGAEFPKTNKEAHHER